MLMDGRCCRISDHRGWCPISTNAVFSRATSLSLSPSLCPSVSFSVSVSLTHTYTQTNTHGISFSFSLRSIKCFIRFGGGLVLFGFDPTQSDSNGPECFCFGGSGADLLPDTAGPLPRRAQALPRQRHTGHPLKGSRRGIHRGSKAAQVIFHKKIGCVVCLGNAPVSDKYKAHKI